jgi:hypothetical protein
VSGDFYRTGMGQKFFERTLPALVSELAQLRKAVAQLTKALGARGDAASDSDRERVLLVHRDADLLRALRSGLGDRYEVHVALTYVTGSELIKLHDFDAVVVYEDAAWPDGVSTLFTAASAMRADARCVRFGRTGEPAGAVADHSGADFVVDDADARSALRALTRILR